ncbi:hypothetical protein VSDG_03493 [Cytospora chrysosperma]|uniref:Uncharacterized protein n=1 Tax=Cytospora chrysosperma TaxID=252740 RepID=A0A423WA91_CYTCH|nr:hypothetical protein VSDG_03493 [Valsa sordida]
MGIQGLLPLLKSIQKQTEIKKFSGEVFGVDAYGWLHRGAVACAIELAQDKPTRKYVDFAMHRVRMLKHFGVTPYLVFDGDYLPSKARTEASRAQRREDTKKAGLELLKAGKPSQAHLELQKAIDVTPEMARHLIDELKKDGIPYVVAPYEADAQLVYLERSGFISGIISEDSDLLVFGAKRLLTKMDQHGQCIEINRRDFCAVREISLTGWTDDQFRQMAIFSGCDYLEGIGNIGLKTAYRMMRKYKTPERVIRMLQFGGKHRVSENYLAQYKQAEMTFLHQRVFCPKKEDIVLLTEPHASSTLDIEEMPYIGAKVDRDLAKAIAVGDVNPISKQPIVVTALPSKRRPNYATSGTPNLPETSKFFPSGKSASQPQTLDNLLMSDDSIEEALANLPDMNGVWNISRTSGAHQTLEVFQDESLKGQSTTTEGADTKDDEIIPDSPIKPQETSVGVETKARRESSGIDGDEAEKPLRGLLKEFSYTPVASKPTNNRTRMEFGLPTPASSTQGSETKQIRSSPADSPFQTPLQRIGAQALQRGKANQSPQMKARRGSGAHGKRRSLRDSLDSFPINPAFVPLPKVDLAEVEALNKPGGSEDQIIPDSDEENDPTIGTDNPHYSSRRLDLSKFMYTRKDMELAGQDE